MSAATPHARTTLLAKKKMDAAREGDGDGIPRDEPLNLRNILNAPAVVRINNWKDLGLELRVEEYELERIDRECRGIIKECKREMFNHWLKNNPHPSWVAVRRAVMKVNSRDSLSPTRRLIPQYGENLKETSQKFTEKVQQRDYSGALCLLMIFVIFAFAAVIFMVVYVVSEVSETIEALPFLILICFLVCICSCITHNDR